VLDFRIPPGSSNISEERRSHLHRDGSLGSRILRTVLYEYGTELFDFFFGKYNFVS